ncbi:Glutamine-dependent NAD(+) synthetase [Ralstonia mannitolilytica]|uniref:Glutamine-dependent NAD(+) synthetase n=1 Tax=Ralstonia mannitolilytica TaxID=105219 RepID=A0ABM9KD16_9RALS|nr:Glutamine-dependent NAD(+) synthetase [Ralstonia mannitolilytica]
MTVTVALAQLNCTVGDFAGNAARIVAAAREAHQAGACILVTPELSLTGYPPEDLLLRPAFIDASARALDALIAELAAFAGLHVLIGHPQISLEPPAPGVLPKPTNACTVAADGRVVGRYHKLDLPNNEVFDEKRYFQPGTEPFVFEVDGTRFGVIICEDAWYPTATAYAKAAGAQVVLIPNASPYHLDKEDLREQIIGARVKESGLPHVYANLVGGQDELVFDGGSFVLDAEGKVVVQMGQFVEGLGYAQFDGGKALPGTIVPEAPLEAQVYEALKLGVRDYLGKNGFPGAIIGLSGGVDSALVLAIAVDALGADRVRAVMMPSRYTADISWVDARDMAARLGVQYDEIPIAPMFDAFKGALAEEFRNLPEDATEENIQARIRGTLLMALSNKSGRIVLTTGNKSEMAVGYCIIATPCFRIATRRSGALQRKMHLRCDEAKSDCLRIRGVVGLKVEEGGPLAFSSRTVVGRRQGNDAWRSSWQVRGTCCSRLVCLTTVGPLSRPSTISFSFGQMLAN